MNLLKSIPTHSSMLACIVLLVFSDIKSEEYWVGSGLLDSVIDSSVISHIENTHDNRRIGLLSGEFKSAVDPGFYHLQYQNFSLNWNGRKKVTGLKWVLSVGYNHDEPSGEAPIVIENDVSIIGAFKKQYTGSGALFFMSIGKTW